MRSKGLTDKRRLSVRASTLFEHKKASESPEALDHYIADITRQLQPDKPEFVYILTFSYTV